MARAGAAREAARAVVRVEVLQEAEEVKSVEVALQAAEDARVESAGREADLVVEAAVVMRAVGAAGRGPRAARAAGLVEEAVPP